MRGWLAGAALVTVVLSGAACADAGSPTSPTPPPGNGGGGNPPPPPPPGGSPTFTGRVNGLDIVSHEVTASRDGTLVVTLSWTGSVDLDLYLTATDCSGYPPDACTILVRSVRDSGTSEEVSRTVRANERYKVWIDNFSNAGADYQVFVEIR